MSDENTPPEPITREQAGWHQLANDAANWDPEHEGLQGLKGHVDRLLEEQGLGHLISNNGDSNPAIAPSPVDDTESSEEAKEDHSATALSDNVKRSFQANLSGEDIVDRFIGGLMATGDIPDSLGQTKTPRDILQELSETPVYRPDPYSPKTSLAPKFSDTFTSSKGLRGGVVALGSDIKTSHLFPTAKDRLAVDNVTGATVLSTPAQVQGYLDTLAHNAGIEEEGWQKVILTELDGHIDDHGAMDRALAIAKSAGADIDLLADSSRYAHNRLMNQARPAA